MFSSFQHTTDVSFRSPSTFYPQQYLHNCHTTTSSSSGAGAGAGAGGVPAVPSDIIISPSQRKAGRKRSYEDNHQDDHRHEDDEKKKKRLEHREIERKRRQEMASLCSSLRSLLPDHCIKGRRSMSEHMNQAVNYIKHLEEKIKGLSTTLDEFKKCCRVTESSFIPKKTNLGSEGLQDSIRPLISVIVECSHGGIEILINSCTKDEGFPISRVVKALVQEGLNFICCNCTIVNERLIYSIQCEGNEEASIQASKLQQKLAELVNSGL